MKKYLLTIIPFALGIACFVAYNIIGSEIAPDGKLVEPFGLIPIGLLLTAIALIIGIVQSTWALFHNPTKVDKWMFGLSLTFIILAGIYLFLSFSYLNYISKKEMSMINIIKQLVV